MARVVVFDAGHGTRLLEDFLIMMASAVDKNGKCVIVGPEVHGFTDNSRMERAGELLRQAVVDFCGPDWKVVLK